MNKDNNVVTPHNPLADPSHCEALRHPGDIAALRSPTVAHSEDMLANAQRAPTQPGGDSEEFQLVLPPPGVPPMPCDRKPRCALTQGHDGDCVTPAEFSPGQAAFATHEEGCEAVRRAVILPQMSPAWEATRDLYRQLRTAQNVMHVWADVGDAALGEITEASPGVHATMMNVAGFAAQAAEMVDRAVGEPTLWTATFNAIVDQASKARAFRLLALASGALLAGPFTVTWDNAVAWCIAYWGSR